MLGAAQEAIKRMSIAPSAFAMVEPRPRRSTWRGQPAIRFRRHEQPLIAERRPWQLDLDRRRRGRPRRQQRPRGVRGAVQLSARSARRKPRHSPATSRRPARPRLSACNGAAQPGPRCTWRGTARRRRGSHRLMSVRVLEVEVLSALAHPHVVRVVGVFWEVRADRSGFPAARGAGGGRRAARVDRAARRPLRPVEQARLTAQAAARPRPPPRPMEPMHRDIKPSNLLLSSARDDASPPHLRFWAVRAPPRRGSRWTAAAARAATLGEAARRRRPTLATAARRRRVALRCRVGRGILFGTRR